MTTRLQIFVSVLLLSLTISAQVPNYVPTSSLVAWYSFNGNTNDLSGNNNTLTAVNGATLAADRFTVANSSYSLDGVNDWLETAGNFYNPSIPHSISIWWKTSDSTKIDQTLFNTNPHTSESFAFHYNGTPTPPYGLSFGLGDGVPGSWTIQHPNSGQISVPSNFTKWHHSVWVRSNSNWTFYHDGVVVFTFTNVANTITSNATLRFGAENNVPSGGAQFKGSLDDIGIWNRALTACEVSQLFAAGIASINATSSTSVLCVGNTATLTGSGATSYTWNPGGIVANSISISPTITTTYTVVGTSTIVPCSATTNIVQNVSPCTGINNFSSMDRIVLNIFPNPNNGQFTIQADGDLNLTILSCLGQVIQSFSLNQINDFTVKLTEMPSGVYFVIGKTNSGLIHDKIIINK